MFSEEMGNYLGKQNLAVNQLLERKEIFADLMNGIVFKGRQVLCPEQMELLSTRSGIQYEKEDKKIAVLERRGDIRMRVDRGTYSVIFASEAQAKAHYAMPIRNMLYDALEYTKQVQELEKKHKESGDRLERDAFLSGITREDRLYPVISIVVYFGKEWDGCKSLYELFHIDTEDENAERLREFLPDYKMNLVNGRSIEHPEYFRTCLQHIFSLLKCNSDKEKLMGYAKEHRGEIQKMDSVEKRAMLVLLGEEKRLRKIIEEKREGEENVDMCQAIDELIMDGRREGKMEGRLEGMKEGKISIIRKKLKQGLSEKVVSEWLDLELEYVESVQMLSQKYPKDTDAQIAEKLLQLELASDSECMIESRVGQEQEIVLAG